MPLLNFIVGLLLLFFGRRLFWLFVGAAGFVAGLLAAQGFVQGGSEWAMVLIPLGAALIGTFLAIFLQKLAIGIGGFLMGAYALVHLASQFGYESLDWMAGAVGGILGALLVLRLFDWGLIFVSALTGSVLISEAFHVQTQMQRILLAGSFIVGVISQVTHHARRPAPQARKDVAATEQPT